MSKDVIKYLLLIAFLPILQEMIFNHILLFGFVNPMVYILFLFVFPVYKNKTWLLLAAFTLGILIDILTNDGGIHAFALVFVAYYRLLILQFIKGTNFTDQDSLRITDLGLPILSIWVLILAFIHHFLVFILEQFSFHLFGAMLWKPV